MDDNASESPKVRAWHANLDRLIRSGGVRFEQLAMTPEAFKGVVNKIPARPAKYWHERREKARAKRVARALESANVKD